MKPKNLIWFIRHGYSVFNQARDQHKLDPSIPYDRHSKDLVDAKLHPKGIEQSIEAQKNVNDKNICYVFVSPLLRALETSQLMFANHPNLGKIKFIVHPLLAEILKNANDIPNHTLKELRPKLEGLEKYKFDFSLFDSLSKPDLYYLLYLDNPIKEQLIKRIEEAKEDEIDIVLEAMRSAKGNIENDFNLANRIKLFKDYLLEFIKVNVKAEEEVAVVTHSEVITHVFAKEFDEAGKPKFMDMLNCEIFQYQL